MIHAKEGIQSKRTASVSSPALVSVSEAKGKTYVTPAVAPTLSTLFCNDDVSQCNLGCRLLDSSKILSSSDRCVAHYRSHYLCT